VLANVEEHADSYRTVRQRSRTPISRSSDAVTNCIKGLAEKKGRLRQISDKPARHDTIAA
jgi:hypothetical protein